MRAARGLQWDAETIESEALVPGRIFLRQRAKIPNSLLLEQIDSRFR